MHGGAQRARCASSFWYRIRGIHCTSSVYLVRQNSKQTIRSSGGRTSAAEAGGLDASPWCWFAVSTRLDTCGVAMWILSEIGVFHHLRIELS